MIDRVAGDAAHAEQLRLRLFRVAADEADVGGAIAIDLRRHRHRVTPPRPQQLEHFAKR